MLSKISAVTAEILTVIEDRTDKKKKKALWDTQILKAEKFCWGAERCGAGLQGKQGQKARSQK